MPILHSSRAALVLCLPRPQNRARKCLCNLRTFKPRRVNISSSPFGRPGLSTRFLMHDLFYPFKFNCNLFQLLLTMDNNTWTIRPYRKNSAIQVPATPDYIHFYHNLHPVPQHLEWIHSSRPLLMVFRSRYPLIPWLPPVLRSTQLAHQVNQG